MRAGIAVSLLALGQAHAEIEKVATTTPSGIRLAWWPKVDVPSAWVRDEQQSHAYGVNAMARKGTNFIDAPSVMYAKAVYKPREPSLKSVADLIAKDRKQFLEDDPSLSIHEIDSLQTADGKSIRVFSFSPKMKGNWERVAYGEEGEFFLVFVLSSRTKTAYEGSISDFEGLVRAYK